MIGYEGLVWVNDDKGKKLNSHWTAFERMYADSMISTKVSGAVAAT